MSGRFSLGSEHFLSVKEWLFNEAETKPRQPNSHDKCHTWDIPHKPRALYPKSSPQRLRNCVVEVEAIADRPERAQPPIAKQVCNPTVVVERREQYARAGQRDEREADRLRERTWRKFTYGAAIPDVGSDRNCDGGNNEQDRRCAPKLSARDWVATQE